MTLSLFLLKNPAFLCLCMDGAGRAMTGRDVRVEIARAATAAFFWRARAFSAFWRAINFCFCCFSCAFLKFLIFCWRSLAEIRGLASFCCKAVSFLCAMQAESFRKVLGKPFSSTMCTGNLRSGTEYLYNALASKDYKLLKNMMQYLLIIISFISGAFIGVLITNALLEKAILISLIPLFISIYIMSDKINYGI